jgi:maltose/maltodextrin transport system substrate-binding protein
MDQRPAERPVFFNYRMKQPISNAFQVSGFRVLFLCFLMVVVPASLMAQQAERPDFCTQSRLESLIPIRPGIPGKRPFWNGHAGKFTYAPAFSNENKNWIVPDPAYYLYTAFSFTDKQTRSFRDTSAQSALTPIWGELPAGQVYLTTEAVSGDGKNRVLAGSRLFFKTSSFCPPYPAARVPYTDALMKGLKFMFNQPHIQHWYSSGKPDHQEHELYCYSAVEVGSVINAMLLYHKYFPDNDTALTIAEKAAGFILENAEPAGAPLAYFPMAYDGNAKFAGNYRGEIIMHEPATTGLTFLALYDRTHDRRYLNAAVHIAETYRKTQLDCGTWYIRINKDSGKPAAETLCIPANIINFLSELTGRYQYTEYTATLNAATRWMWENPMQTWDWTGQFEDVAAQKPYENLTKYEASWFAMYLLNHATENPSYADAALELIAFCEDQFVVWDKPGIYDTWGNASDGWHTPAVLEQYKCYVPIDASAVQMITTFSVAFQKTGNPLYREKARALAASVVNTQEESGRIPTFWAPGFTEFWNNCMTSSLGMLDRVNSISGF